MNRAKKIDYTLLSEPVIYREKAKESGIRISNLKKHGVKLVLCEEETTRIIKEKLKKLAPKFNVSVSEFMKIARRVELKFQIRDGGNGLKFELRQDPKVDVIMPLAKTMAKKFNISVKELYSRLRTIK